MPYHKTPCKGCVTLVHKDIFLESGKQVRWKIMNPTLIFFFSFKTKGLIFISIEISNGH